MFFQPFCSPFIEWFYEDRNLQVKRCQKEREERQSERMKTEREEGKKEKTKGGKSEKIRMKII